MVTQFSGLGILQRNLSVYQNSCSATLGKSKITARSSSAHILHAYLAINTFEIPSVFPLELLAIYSPVPRYFRVEWFEQMHYPHDR